MKNVSISNFYVKNLLTYRFQNPILEDLVENKKTFAYRLMYMEKGYMDVFINGQKYSLHEGDLIFIPANVVYSTRAYNEYLDLYVVVFSVNDEEDLINSVSGDYLKFNRDYVVNFSDYDDFNHVVLSRNINCHRQFQEIFTLYKTKSQTKFLKINALIILLLVKIIENSGHNVQKTLVTQIIEYIDQNITNDISCDSIANHFKYNLNYLSKLVRKDTGRSISSYILREKCRVAANWILETNMTISEIAKELGFCSTSHFTNTFIKIMKCTPSMYKKITKK